MICPNCGTQIPDGFRFCTNCGSPLPAVQQAPAVPMPPVYEQAAPVPDAFTQPPVEQAPVPAEPTPVESAPVVAEAPVLSDATPADETKSLYPDLPVENKAEYIPNPMDAFAPAEDYVPLAPVPAQPAPYESYSPAPTPAPQKEKKSGGFSRVLPWILVGLLAVALGLGGFFGYKEYTKIADERDKYYLEGEGLKEEKAALQDDYDALKKEHADQVDSYSSELDRLISENDSLSEMLDGDSVILEYYDDVLWYAENYNIGGTAVFGAEPAVVFMHTSDANKTFKLNTQFENGSITMSTYGYSADGDFTEDNWGDSTTITVTAYEPGVSLLEFSLEDGSYPAFGVLVIVTD